MNTSRRGFLAALLASPLLAKLDLSMPEEFTLQQFAEKCMKAKKGDIFLVSETMYKKLWDLLGPEKYGSVEVMQAGFDHMLFHGKPVLWYPDGERDWLVHEIAHYLGKDGRLNVTEIT